MPCWSVASPDDADARARELERARNVLRLAHHEALTVVDQNAREADAERGIGGGRHGDLAREHVDVARLQRRQPFLERQRAEAHCILAAEHSRRQCAAEVDADAGPLPLRVEVGIALRSIADAAQELAARAYGLEHAAVGPCRQDKSEEHDHQRQQSAGGATHSGRHCRPFMLSDELSEVPGLARACLLR